MKKLITILSIILTLTLVPSMSAFADAWETDPIDLDFDTTVSITKCKITNIVSKTYTGKVVHQSPKVTYQGAALTLGTHYTLSYKKNISVGTATVTVKGKGKFNSSVKKTFKINPKGTTISKLSRPKTKQIKVTWKKQTTQTSGYQIKYATNSKFTSAKYTSITKNSSSVKTLKNLKKNKKYFVRIRTYKIVNGQKYYSSWSSYKAITTK